jgi:hypothetical protein
MNGADDLQGDGGERKERPQQLFGGKIVPTTIKGCRKERPFAIGFEKGDVDLNGAGNG